MGTLRKRGNNWHIDYRAYGQRYRECIGTSRKLAQDVLRKRMVEIAEGKFLDKKKKFTIKFEEFASNYVEVYSKHNKKSWKDDVSRISVLGRTFNGMPLHKITPLMVEEYKAKRVKEVKPATVNRELACLKHMFTKAVAWNKAEDNPVKKVKLFKENNKRLRYLEQHEVDALLAVCNGYLKNIVVVALNTGMRRGEILGLKWADIDFRRGIIYLLETKNGHKREVPMNKSVKQALVRQRKHKDSEYVFYKKDGSSIGSVKKSFLYAIKKTGIINFKFHDLRHTFASHLVMSGIDLNTVRELLGHKSMQMTLRYAHLSPGFRQGAVEVLDRKWSPDGHREVKADSQDLSSIEKSLKTLT
ncbi:MAG: tyrosine-type recombinase/integrase [Candidatus Omnitrophica bacterium]|nr:tyrosine-type recombinase/integrase [Candidatus Omnitrophota bacterium]